MAYHTKGKNGKAGTVISYGGIRNTMIYLFSFLKSLEFFGAVAVPFYLQRMEFSYTQMFLMETIFSVCLFLFEIPTGVVADRLGRKTSLFLGALLLGGSFTALGIIHSVPVFVLIQVVSACGFSMISGADKALVYENAKFHGKTDEEAVVAASRYDAFSTAGMFIAFPAGSLFVSSGIVPYIDALGLVFVATGICIIGAGFVVLLVCEGPLNVLPPEERAFRHAYEGFTYVFRNKLLLRFSLNYAVLSALTFLMFWFYQSLLLDNKIPVAWNGFISAGFNAGGMILLMATGFVNRKVGTKNALFLSSLVPGILYVLLFLFPHFMPVVFTAIFGITMLRFFRAPLLTTLMNTQIANENRATVLSGVSMVERIIISLFYPLAGMLMDFSARWTYLIVGTATLVVSFVLRVGRIKQPDSVQPPACV